MRWVEVGPGADTPGPVASLQVAVQPDLFWHCPADLSSRRPLPKAGSRWARFVSSFVVAQSVARSSSFAVGVTVVIATAAGCVARSRAQRAFIAQVEPIRRASRVDAPTPPARVATDER